MLNVFSSNCDKLFKFSIVEDYTQNARFPEDDKWPEISFPPKSALTHTLQFPALLSAISHKPFSGRLSYKGVPVGGQNVDQAPENQFSPSAECRDITEIKTAKAPAICEEHHFRRVHHMLEHSVPRASGANWFGNSRLPLIQAAAQANARWVQELLLLSDIEPDIRSFQGWTPLQQACLATSGEVEGVVKQLIKFGADINAVPGHGYSMTALQAACSGGRKPLIELLLSHGADLHAPPGGNGHTALGEACFSGHLEIVQLLLEHDAQVNQTIEPLQGSSALTAAAQNGSLAIVELLLKHGADPNDALALQMAVAWNREAIAKRLIELGADVNAAPHVPTEDHGLRHTAIALASSLSMVTYLVAHGANVNGAVYDEGGATAVQRAAAHPSTEVLEELIRLGGDVNAPAATGYGRTALQAAAYCGQASHVRLLVDKYGATTNTPRNTRIPVFSALEAAAHYAAVQWYEAQRHEARRHKVQQYRDFEGSEVSKDSNSLSILEFLLDRGAELTALPLHTAAAWGYEELGELLLRRGADPNLPPNFLVTDSYIEKWGEDRDMGLNVFETARLNGRTHFLAFLQNWCIEHEVSHTKVSLDE